MTEQTKINADTLINQIAETLCEVDIEFLCDIADRVLAAKHQSAGEDEFGYDLIEQTWKESGREAKDLIKLSIRLKVSEILIEKLRD